MVSDKFMVNSDAERLAASRYATENFAWKVKLDKRATLRLDLLVEETLGMVNAMLGDFYGQLWFVENADGACEIHFEATTDMDADKKRELIAMSTTGKNASARGFMAKLGEVISNALFGLGDSMDIYGQETIRYGIVHMPYTDMSGMELIPVWTLHTYRDELAQANDGKLTAEAIEDLEKSIVASLADDIVVGVKGDRVDMIITKKF